jgi:3-oxoacyl-[acyl-carrier-protein] synthase II
MAMHISGVGVLCACGRGPMALENALRSGGDTPSPVRAVPPEALEDKVLFKGMRRADRLGKFAVMAAADAWNDSGAAGMDPSRVGIVLASALGPHVRTFEFLDGILDFGQGAVSPTAFSHSVHNAAVSYIAAALQTHGPTLTVTDFCFGFQQAVAIAHCWLAEGRCDGVLVGAAEELGEVMLHVCRRMLTVPEDGRPRPFAFGRAHGPVPGEGAVFFMLSNRRSARDYAALSLETDVPQGADRVFVDPESFCGSEMDFPGTLPAGAALANDSPLFGNMMTGSAFYCLAAALTLRNGVRPRGLLSEEATSAVNTIACLKLGRRGERQILVVSR